MATAKVLGVIQNPKRGGTVHIRAPYGKAAICGVRKPHFHGGPKTATCKRCLAHPVTRDWGKRTAHTYDKTVEGCWCEACADSRYKRRKLQCERRNVRDLAVV